MTIFCLGFIVGYCVSCTPAPFFMAERFTKVSWMCLFWLCICWELWTEILNTCHRCQDYMTLLLRLQTSKSLIGFNNKKEWTPDHSRLYLFLAREQALYGVLYGLVHTSNITTTSLKVAEHSFRARYCQYDSARAQGLQKPCRRYSNYFTCSMPAFAVLFFFIIERSVLMVLVFYYKGMWRMVTMQRTHQFSAFLCYRKNRVKCSAWVVSQKIAIKCETAFSEMIFREPLFRISRNLARKYFLK